MTESKDHHAEHANHTPVFVAVFLMLCGLTAVSYWVANSSMMTDNLNMARGCLIAVSAAKAILVVTFFMHLWWEKRWKYVLTLPALILAVVMVLLLIPDIGLRTETYSTDRKIHGPIPQSPEHLVHDRSEH